MRDDAFVLLAHEGPLSLVTMNRPDKLNALSQEVLADLKAAIAELQSKGYILLREKDIHAVAASRVDDGNTGLYL